MLTVQQKLIRICQERAKAHYDDHVVQNEPTEPLTTFAVNSYVLRLHEHKPPHKLATRWAGPFKVMGSTGSHVTLLNLLVTNMTTESHHVSRLKVFHYFPGIHDPTDIAARDAGESVVEKILDHHGERWAKNDMQFLVKWLGQGPDENLWMDYKSLKFIPAFHDYCLANGLRDIIPRASRPPRS
jgi:hypothetical protein